MSAHEPEPPPRVVVATSDPDVRLAIEFLLDELIHVARYVSGGQALMDAVLEIRPDVVVSDVNAPGITGVEVPGRPRRAPRQPAVVLVSGTARNLTDWLEDGARCVVHTADLGADLIPAIFAAARGEVYISRRAMAA